MTNLEWFKKRINEISAEELGKAWENEVAPWCDGNCRDIEDACIGCVERWGVKPYKEPMPELKIGMFVKVDNSFSTHLGIIVYNKEIRDLAVAYKNGGCDYLHCVTVRAVYDAMSFNDCDDGTCIWSKE